MVEQQFELDDVVHPPQNGLVFLEQFQNMSVITIKNLCDNLEEVAPFFDGDPKGVALCALP